MPSPHPDAAAAIRIDGLSHRYGASLALDNVSLTLPGNATIGLIGPDGVGKSTLLGVIAGVKRIQHGNACVLGADLRDRQAREALLPRVAFMPQGLGRNLYPTLSVYENVDFFARLFGLGGGERRQRIERLLAATGLAPFPDRPAGKLSGGMKQKLGLCCALVHNPDLLILDEPTTGVDPLSRRQFWALVEDLRAEHSNMTVIVATAYIEEAQRFGHLVAMDAGKVLVCDRTADVLARAGTSDLEQAYISLLPAQRRGDAAGLVIPPRPPDGDEPAIEAEGLTRRFGAFTAVDNVSFRIERSEIFGFLGSNGCGKTTTMKMLTGLLDATSGTARLLGQTIDAGDMRTRMRVGYMSQAFSLYEELTVRQNLDLHARLYRMEGASAQNAVGQALLDFELDQHAGARPASLSLGIRQRLQLAAACLHHPEVLILDEPTSGVDPGARDMFWRHLVQLSRQQRVTIFVSTHFMNEAARCDRISFMHRGRVLAVGSPEALREGCHAQTLEDAFVSYLEQAENPRNGAAATAAAQAVSVQPSPARARQARPCAHPGGSPLARTWAFARREAMELARDKLRLAFAILGPITDAVHSEADADRRLRAAAAMLIVELPPGFERDLLAGRQPQLAFRVDGSSPFPGATTRAYVTGVLLAYANAQLRAQAARPAALPVSIETRFIYNQEFRSIYAITPGIIMLALILIPTMLTALGVVREKEMGSITNLYASPASVGEYLIGKQLPYVGLAMISYLTLVALAIVLLQVPLKGSFLALSIGAALFVLAATALGLLMSTFVRSQVAAIFGTAILCLIPSVNFSGLLYPVSTLTGSSYWIGQGFPSSWFQLISLGSFTKGLGAGSFGTMYLALLGFALLYLAGARLLLRKQEA
ncbi:ABC transporter related protein [Cupriavidus basilensis OR16]|uniref:ABC transporter related protein n=1 Tax=Cupriavidus basilensis OR16 TaxID=1127483 RepID=H1SGD4_9BURK|nr:ABC transporter ATP-binding protein/permease [Cupriavidus basilensis]EHP38472.1 ABC transporter related protein [Cupriavidus basilensis OR16]